jgi:hypothetical protein
MSAASSAINLVRSFVDVRDEAKVLQLKAELLGLLVEAQQAQAALVDEKRALAERVRELEAWDCKKERYQLEAVGYGGFAYALKPDTEPNEPAHYLCAACFDHGQPSVLHKETRPGRAEYLACHTCGSDILLRGVASPEHTKFRIVRRH